MGADMILRILKIDWTYRKCDYCLRKGKNHWMHGGGLSGAKSVTGDFCSKHEYKFKDKVKEVFGPSAL